MSYRPNARRSLQASASCASNSATEASSTPMPSARACGDRPGDPEARLRAVAALGQLRGVSAKKGMNWLDSAHRLVRPGARLAASSTPADEHGRPPSASPTRRPRRTRAHLSGWLAPGTGPNAEIAGCRRTASAPTRAGTWIRATMPMPPGRSRPSRTTPSARASWPAHRRAEVAEAWRELGRGMRRRWTARLVWHPDAGRPGRRRVRRVPGARFRPRRQRGWHPAAAPAAGARAGFTSTALVRTGPTQTTATSIRRHPVRPRSSRRVGYWLYSVASRASE